LGLHFARQGFFLFLNWTRGLPCRVLPRGAAYCGWEVCGGWLDGSTGRRKPSVWVAEWRWTRCSLGCLRWCLGGRRAGREALRLCERRPYLQAGRLRCTLTAADPAGFKACHIRRLCCLPLVPLAAYLDKVFYLLMAPGKPPLARRRILSSWPAAANTLDPFGLPPAGWGGVPMLPKLPCP
jgi:hypothetical protein